MNYNEPRQREKDKRWDFTTRNDDRIRPLGYCAGLERTRKLIESARANPVVQGAEKWWDEYERGVNANESKFHDDGHETADEAVACYREYQLDFELRFRTPADPTTLNKCRECGAFTGSWVEIGSGVPLVFPLCQEHSTRDVVAKHFKGGSSIES